MSHLQKPDEPVVHHTRFLLTGLISAVFTTLALSLGLAGLASADATSFGTGVLTPTRSTGIAVGSDGSVFVSEGAGSSGLIHKFSAGGAHQTSWGTLGYDGEFARPYQVAVGLLGHVYATDPDNQRVQEFDNDGHFIRAWTTERPMDPPQTSAPYGIATGANGDVYVTNPTANRIQRYDSTGTFLNSWGEAGNSFDDVIVGPSNEVYIADSTHRRISKFTSTGTLLDQWGGAAGSGNGQFTNLSGLGITPDGNVLVADQRNYRIQESTSDGAFVGKFGTPGSGATQLGEPSDVAAGPTGRIYIADQNNSRIVSLNYEPSATIAPAGVVQTDQLFTLDGSGSSAPLSAITNYSWDLNGDGVFETDTGTSSTVQTTLSSPGDQPVRLRVVTAKGLSADVLATVDVRLASPPGPLGVSINEGDQFTNDPDVLITARWPHFATDLVISNDGGFTPSTQSPVTAALPWKLRSSGPERLPKTIYVRFLGGGSGVETYQDDIILDETPPDLASVEINGPSGSARPLPAKSGAVKLRIKAEDKTSGVAKMQVTNKKSKPGKWNQFRAKTKFRSSASKVFVRVRDRAGNRSRWKRAI